MFEVDEETFLMLLTAYMADEAARDELILQLAEATGLSQGTVVAILNALFEFLAEQQPIH
jgi:hypothetical protein